MLYTKVVVLDQMLNFVAKTFFILDYLDTRIFNTKFIEVNKMDRILYLVITNSVACVVVGCAHARQYVMGSNPKKLNQCPIDMIL